MKRKRKAMKHTERIRTIAINLNLPYSAVEGVWNAIGPGVLYMLARNRDVIIPRFMTIGIRKRPRRRYWDERTKRTRESKARKMITASFHPSMRLRLKTIGF